MHVFYEFPFEWYVQFSQWTPRQKLKEKPQTRRIKRVDFMLKYMYVESRDVND